MLLLYWNALLWRNTLKQPMNYLSQNQVAIGVIKYEGIDKSLLLQNFIKVKVNDLSFVSVFPSFQNKQSSIRIYGM